MSQKQRKLGKTGQERNWEETADIFEGAKGHAIMKASRALNAIERRKLLGPGKTKLISVRVPEEDIEALRNIAEKNDRKYQQLIIQAIEKFLEEYLRRFKKANH
ncbi:MAG TPA: hypothetical protein VJB34_03410 [Bdellovibrionota bacterium]|nr:hypothetical protein [Bdellovibrionota bacterium]